MSARSIDDGKFAHAALLGVDVPTNAMDDGAVICVAEMMGKTEFPRPETPVGTVRSRSPAVPAKTGLTLCNSSNAAGTYWSLSSALEKFGRRSSVPQLKQTLSAYAAQRWVDSSRKFCDATMTYATLLVHLQLGQSNASLLSVAGQFADRFNAHVIGIAACQPMVTIAGDGMIGADVGGEDLRQIAKALDIAQAEFREALQSRSTRLEWRSKVTLAGPVSYLSGQVRCADLIMTGSVPADPFNLSRATDTGSLVMEAGRPVFIVPPDAQPMRFDSALIAWKDTRECRRATADALPLLKETGRVAILEIAAIDDLDAAQLRVMDVASWLERHGVKAHGLVERSRGNDVDQIHCAANERSADVIVAGAYGHSRLHEWVIGGVTREFLLECRRSVLISH